MSDKVAELTVRLKTIKNMANAAETRELCLVVAEVLKLVEAEDRELGFTGMGGDKREKTK